MISMVSTQASAPELKNALLAGDLPIEDLDEPGRSFFRVERDGVAIGYCGFELYGDDALIRSIVVPPEHRGRGFGRAVTEALLTEVRNAGARRTWLLTNTAVPFFERLGFVRTERAGALPSILETRQATSICASAALMSREVS